MPDLRGWMRARRGPAGRPELQSPSGREWLFALVVIVAATGALLHEQIAQFTSVPDFGDPLFSMWRLAWIAHQLPPIRGTCSTPTSSIRRCGRWRTPTRCWFRVHRGAGACGSACRCRGLHQPDARDLCRCRAGDVCAGACGDATTRERHSSRRSSSRSTRSSSHTTATSSCSSPAGCRSRAGVLPDATPGGCATGPMGCSSRCRRCPRSTTAPTWASRSRSSASAGWSSWPGRAARLSWRWPPVSAWRRLVAAAVTTPYRANRATVGDRGLNEIEAFSARPIDYLRPHPRERDVRVTGASRATPRNVNCSPARCRSCSAPRQSWRRRRRSWGRRSWPWLSRRTPPWA